MKAPISLAQDFDTMPSAPEPSKGIHVTLPDVAELKGMPLSGLITFRFERKEVSLREEDDVSVTLCLCEVTKVKGDPKKDDKKVEEVVDELFNEAIKAEKSESE